MFLGRISHRGRGVCRFNGGPLATTAAQSGYWECVAEDGGVGACYSQASEWPNARELALT